MSGYSTRQHLNQGTQPVPVRRVFNNWDVVARAWFLVMPSASLKKGKAISQTVCGQHLVFFRGADGRVRALDGFCPHMGTDLGIGRVVENNIQCFFHHWQFDGAGQLAKIPNLAANASPPQACLASYAVQEKYGSVWVYPEATAPFPVPEHEGLAGQAVSVWQGQSYTRTCHPHVTMINGIDPQHLATVHGLHFEMSVDVALRQEQSLMDFHLKGDVPSQTSFERVWKKVLGSHYGYSMRYSAGSMGLLTAFRYVKLFGRLKMPELFLIYAYRVERPGLTRVFPLFVTRKREGLWGKLVSAACLVATRIGYHVLKGEDGRVYENMRFHPGALLAIDAPVGKFLGFIEKIPESGWIPAETHAKNGTKTFLENVQ